MSYLSRNKALSALIGFGALLATAIPGYALDQVTYGTNWLAQAEHGGSTRPGGRASTRSTAST
mgnify:CR=1 FL=1